VPSFGADATVLQALAPVTGRAGMEVALEAGALRAALSPARIRQLEAVMAQVAPEPEPIRPTSATLRDFAEVGRCRLTQGYPRFISALKLNCDETALHFRA